MAGLGRGPTYRVILLGELGVGKTSLFRRIKDDSFDDHQPATSGIDSCSKYLAIDGEDVHLAVWDTAGVERFRTLTRNYYRNADATVFVYSVTDTASLHYLTQWLKDAQLHSPEALRVIVGNKVDLDGQIEVEESVAQAFADLQKITFVHRISCKTNSGIEHFVTELTKEVHARAQLVDEPAGPESIRPGLDQGKRPENGNDDKCNC